MVVIEPNIVYGIKLQRAATKKSVDQSFGGSLREVAVAKSNSYCIYVSRNEFLYKSIDGGATWAQPNFGMTALLGNAWIESIAINPTNENMLWIGCDRYTEGKKVFKSIDGGVSWTNISGTLPIVPTWSIIYEMGSNDLLYLGTECGGLYYIDNKMND